MEKGINRGLRINRGLIFGATAFALASTGVPREMPIAGDLFAFPVAEAAGSFSCRAFSGSAQRDCYDAKNRELQRMGAKQGTFKRNLRNCTRSYRSYRYEKPVWDKVRSFCIRNGNPRKAPYLGRLSKRYKLRIPADCVRACGVAAGKAQYYTQWKIVCK